MWQDGRTQKSHFPKQRVSSTEAQTEQGDGVLSISHAQNAPKQDIWGGGMTEWANVNSKELESSQTLNFLTFLTDTSFKVAEHYKCHPIEETQTNRRVTKSWAGLWQAIKKNLETHFLLMTCSGVVKIVCDILKQVIKCLTAFEFLSVCNWLKNADDFLCNHLLCLKSHYLHANAVRGKTLILWAPFEMKIGNVLGMVRKKENGKKKKRKKKTLLPNRFHWRKASYTTQMGPVMFGGWLGGLLLWNIIRKDV